MRTTIQIETTTRNKLNNLKPYKRATYDEIIEALMDLIPEGDDEGMYTPEFRASLLRGLLDLRHNRVYSNEEVKKSFGL